MRLAVYVSFAEKDEDRARKLCCAIAREFETKTRKPVGIESAHDAIKFTDRVVAVISKNSWTALEAGELRLDDTVRIELEIALELEKNPLILLVDDGDFPASAPLPVSLAPISRMRPIKAAVESFEDDLLPLLQQLRLGSSEVDSEVLAAIDSPQRPDRVEQGRKCQYGSRISLAKSCKTGALGQCGLPLCSMCQVGRDVRPGWQLQPDYREYRWWNGRCWTGSVWRPPSQTFLCYAHSDSDLVRRVSTDLRSAGIRVWSDVSLETGVMWWEGVLDNIRMSAVLVFVVSEDSLNSEVCSLERAYAAALGIRILYVLIRDADLLSRVEGGRHMADYRLPNTASAIKLVADVQSATFRVARTAPSLANPPGFPFDFLVEIGSRVRDPEITEAERHELMSEIRNLVSRTHDRRARRSLQKLAEQLRDELLQMRVATYGTWQQQGL
jgi:hypothetical protein